MEWEDTLYVAGWALSHSWVCDLPPVLFLPCLGAGVPMQLLQSAGHLQILSEGQVLQIKPASVSDSGHYTCVATNVVGEDDRDFIVHVQGEPWVTSQCLEQWVSQQVEGSFVGSLVGAEQHEQEEGLYLLENKHLLGSGQAWADALVASWGASPRLLQLTTACPHSATPLPATDKPQQSPQDVLPGGRPRWGGDGAPAGRPWPAHRSLL